MTTGETPKKNVSELLTQVDKEHEPLEQQKYDLKK